MKESHVRGITRDVWDSPHMESFITTYLHTLTLIIYLNNVCIEQKHQSRRLTYIPNPFPELAALLA